MTASSPISTSTHQNGLPSLTPLVSSNQIVPPSKILNHDPPRVSENSSSSSMPSAALLINPDQPSVNPLKAQNLTGGMVSAEGDPEKSTAMAETNNVDAPAVEKPSEPVEKRMVETPVKEQAMEQVKDEKLNHAPQQDTGRTTDQADSSQNHTQVSAATSATEKDSTQTSQTPARPQATPKRNGTTSKSRSSTRTKGVFSQTKNKSAKKAGGITFEHVPDLGTMLWAKVKGFSMWPGKLVDIESIPLDAIKQNVLADKPVKAKDPLLVHFMGTWEYAWLTLEAVRPFEPNLERFRPPKSGKGSKALRNAVEQALKPEDAEKAYEAHIQEIKEQAESLADEEPMDEDDYKSTPKPTKRATTRRSTASKPKRRNTYMEEDNELEEDSEPIPDFDEMQSSTRKRKAPPTPAAQAPPAKRTATSSRKTKGPEKDDNDTVMQDTPSVKKNSKNAKKTAAETSEASGSKSRAKKSNGTTKEAEPSSAVNDADSDKAKNKSNKKSPHDRLLRLRHALQRIVKSDQKEEDMEMNWEKVSEVISQVENFQPVDLELLRETKIGKVVRKLKEQEWTLPANTQQMDKYKIKERVNGLLESWKKLHRSSKTSKESTAKDTSVDGKPEAVDTKAATEAKDSKDSPAFSAMTAGTELPSALPSAPVTAGDEKTKEAAAPHVEKEIVKESATSSKANEASKEVSSEQNGSVKPSTTGNEEQTRDAAKAETKTETIAEAKSDVPQVPKPFESSGGDQAASARANEIVTSNAESGKQEAANTVTATDKGEKMDVDS